YYTYCHLRYRPSSPTRRSSDLELIIITHRLLRSQAERLSAYKNSTGISSQVVLLGDIYSSFGYGNPDVTAIRNFLAYHYLHGQRSEEHTSELQSRENLVCRLLL